MDAVRRLALLLPLLALACSPERPGGLVPSVTLTPCRAEGIGHVAECGQVQVFEDQQNKSGETIALRVVRMPATGSAPMPDPLFLLAGGPGQAATEAFAPLLPRMARLNLKRDIVMVDMRGTGSSAPLDCEEPSDLAEQLRVDALERTVDACVDALDRDTTLYTTEAAADDLDAVRSALGYERINLLGMSYGTRLAMVYAQRHPAALRSMVLDGVAPPWMKIPASFARDAQSALDKVWARCAAGPCGKAFPKPAANLRELLDELAEEPREVTIAHPRTGEPITFTMTRDMLALGLRGLLYAPEITALLPYTLSRARAGDYAPFAAQNALLLDFSADKMSIGLMLSVVCREDVARIDDSDLDSKGTFVGDAVVDAFRRACSRWPHGKADPTLYARPKLDTPTLILSGELDPVTPSRWGDDVVEDLVHGRHIVVPGMSHGVSIRSCVPRLLRTFFDVPERVATLRSSCLSDDAPPFFLDVAGPRE